MRAVTNIVLSIYLLIFISGCSLFSTNNNDESDPLDQHSIRRASYWDDVSSSSPLEQRIHQELPKEVSDFVKIWLEKKKIPQNYKRPKAVVEKSKFFALFKKSFKDLPNEIKNKMSKRLKAVYLIDGIGASIFTLQLKDSNGPVNQFIAFCDKEILNQPINDWYKWRELTAFAPQEPYQIVPHLAVTNDPLHTIQYAALQLYAIMLSFDEKFYPKDRNAMLLQMDNYPFLKSSWKVENETVFSNFNEHEEANNLNFIRYYTKDNPAFTLARLSNYYAFLEETNFVNLYAFMGPSRDFVESIANFLYVEKLGNPFNIVFKRGDKNLRVFNSCWNKRRCLKKRELIESLLRMD